MTYYHQTKSAALEAAKAYESHWSATASLEPFNGWVITLRPKTYEVLAYNLLPLLEVAELDIGRLWVRPAHYKKPPTQAYKATPRAKHPRPAPPPPPAPPAPPQALAK